MKYLHFKRRVSELVWGIPDLIWGLVLGSQNNTPTFLGVGVWGQNLTKNDDAEGKKPSALLIIILIHCDPIIFDIFIVKRVEIIVSLRDICL